MTEFLVLYLLAGILLTGYAYRRDPRRYRPLLLLTLPVLWLPGCFAVLFRKRKPLPLRPI